MNLFNLTKYNLKRYLKNPLMLFINVGLTVIILLSISNTDSDLGNIGIINKDGGTYSKALIKEIEKEFSVTEYKGSVDKHYNKIIDNDIGVLYVIDKNFEEEISKGNIPKIKGYTLENSSGMVFANNIIDKYISDKLINNNNNNKIDTSKYIETIIEKGDSVEFDNYILIMIMVCYFMLISSTIIAEDIAKLKVQKVLKRALSTGNSDRVILGSMYIASFLLQCIGSLLSLIIAVPFLDMELFYFGRAIIVVVLTSLISTSIVVISSRYIKNPGLVSIVCVIYGLIAFVLAIVTLQLDDFTNISAIFKGITVISPLTWAINILKFEKVIQSITVLILMSIAFFTAGTFRLREYVRE